MKYVQVYNNVRNLPRNYGVETINMWNTFKLWHVSAESNAYKIEGL
jgi:hypothetical protein